MIWLNIVTLLVVIGGVVSLWYFFFRSAQTLRRELSEATLRMNEHLTQTSATSQKAGEGTLKMMSDVYQKLGVLEESSQKLSEIGKEVGQLQNVLKAPKTRGGFGELLLADILSQMIPKDRFQLQYQFRSGTRVDAAIFLSDHLVSVDAKFPLENFQRIAAGGSDDELRRYRKDFRRDVKRHVDAISERYICTEEGTFDFALMYIPAENVYYEVIATGEEDGGEPISKYALSQRVIPVSPNSIYAYLQVILLGLRGLRIDEAAREIAESLMRMQGDFSRMAGNFGTLGTHINHARSSFERVQREMDQFEGKLAAVDQVKAVAGDQKPKVESASKK